MMTLTQGTMNYKEAVQELYNSLAGNDEERQEVAFQNFAEALAEKQADEINEQVGDIRNQLNDEWIMSQRGIRKPLNTEERNFFNEAVQKQTIEGLEEKFPTTIIEDIMKDLSQDHPVLSAIDMRYTTYAIKYIYGDPAEQTAYWDVIPADIRQILIGAFKEMDMTVSKLSGYIALPKGYFQLGPSWLANYVTTFLREVMDATLETAVINGDGNLKPIGMMKKLSGAVDGVYPAKGEVALTDLTPRSFAGPRALLAREKMLNGGLSLIINPETNATKVAPNLFFQNTETGAWAQIGLPYGITVIESYAVPVDKAVLGNPKNYILAVAGNMEIKKYEETLAIEDMDLYIAKMFATGVAKNANAFVVLDLSKITGVTVPESDEPADIQRQNTVDPANSSDSWALDENGDSITPTPEV